MKVWIHWQKYGSIQLRKTMLQPEAVTMNDMCFVVDIFSVWVYVLTAGVLILRCDLWTVCASWLYCSIFRLICGVYMPTEHTNPFWGVTYGLWVPIAPTYKFCVVTCGVWGVRCEPVFPDWEYNSFRLTLVLGQYCSLYMFCIRPIASPPAMGSISGTPVLWCCPALHCLQFSFSLCANLESLFL